MTFLVHINNIPKSIPPECLIMDPSKWELSQYCLFLLINVFSEFQSGQVIKYSFEFKSSQTISCGNYMAAQGLGKIILSMWGFIKWRFLYIYSSVLQMLQIYHLVITSNWESIPKKISHLSSTWNYSVWRWYSYLKHILNVPCFILLVENGGPLFWKWTK